MEVQSREGFVEDCIGPFQGEGTMKVCKLVCCMCSISLLSEV